MPPALFSPPCLFSGCSLCPACSVLLAGLPAPYLGIFTCSPSKAELEASLFTKGLPKGERVGFLTIELVSTNHSEWMMSQPMSKATQSRYQHSFCSDNAYSAISALYNGVASSQLGLTLDSVLPKCHLGVLAQASVTKHRRLGSLNDSHELLSVLEAGSPRSMCQEIHLLVRTLFLACTWPPSLCVITWWRERALVCLPLPIRVLIALWGPHPHDLL